MITTRLTEKLGIKHPVIQAPMAIASGGKLAAAVSSAGGLGMIGGGYGDENWLLEQFDAAGNQQVGCGFITWALAEQPHLLTQVLERNPSAIFLSFGDPAPFVEITKAANVPVICHIRVTGSPGVCPSCGFAFDVLNQTFDIVVPFVSKLIL